MTQTLEEAQGEIMKLRKRIRKLIQNTAMECCECGGYWLCLADGSRICSCESDPEMTEASK